MMATNGKQVFIVGPRKIQNRLMAEYVREEVGLPCMALTSSEAGELKRSGSKQNLVLRDCPGLNGQHVRQQLSPEGRFESGPDQILAIFNVPPGKDIERETIPLGIRGFFYREDEPETLRRGIGALFEGELWMSHKAMAECLINGHRGDHYGRGDPGSGLTKREMEVLATVAAGGSNEDVAVRLCISSHTVKTHIYRIFRKIGASNRLEAALWAARNL
ncbi:MAG: response regulator transcription factor [Deltaproteobacteria bacterium]|nr:response regulator transcription factor [Deltaproteobacteria bacterium]